MRRPSAANMVRLPLQVRALTDPVSLSASVGPGQANRPADLQLLRGMLNAFVDRGLLDARFRVATEGEWDASVAAALQAVENQYFFGEADPDNKLDTNDTLFQFLVHGNAASQALAATLTNETYMLAAVMVPGGVDRTKRTVLRKQVMVKGRMVTQKEVHTAAWLQLRRWPMPHPHRRQPRLARPPPACARPKRRCCSAVLCPAAAGCRCAAAPT
jgi:hypothetical protein